MCKTAETQDTDLPTRLPDHLLNHLPIRLPTYSLKSLTFPPKLARPKFGRAPPLLQRHRKIKQREAGLGRK